jgi:hypothetical protein
MIDFNDYPDAVEITVKIRGGLDYTSENFDEPEYHIVLSVGGSDPQPRISYHLTKFKGKSRLLSRFENNRILEELKKLTLQIPDQLRQMVICDPPTPWYQLHIRCEGTSLDMTWDSGEVNDGENTNSANGFVELIQEVEPLDYEGLGVAKRDLD